MNIFKLVGSVVLDGASNVESQLDSIDTKGKKAGSAFETFGKVAKGVGTAVTVAGTGLTALGAAVTKVAGQNDVIDKMSQKIGISTTSYQEWSYAMGQSGVDVSKLQTAMVKVTDAADKALNGNEAYAASFATLGVALTNADGSMRSQEEILNESVLALADMEDTTQRAIIGNDLFGKSFSDMNPLLNEGSDGITALKDRAHELGIVIDEEAIKSSVAFGDILSDLQQSLGALVTNGLSPLMSPLQEAAEALTGLLTGREGAGEEFSSAITGFITKGIDTIINMLPNLVEAGTNILFSLIDGLTANIDSIVGTATSIIFTLVDAIIDNLPELLTGAIEIVLALANGIIDAIPELLERLPEIIIAIVDGLLQNLPTLILAGPQIMIALIKGIIDAIPTLVASIPQIIKAIVDGFAGAVGEFVQLGKNVIDGLVQGIKDFAMKPVDAVVNAGKKVVDGFKKFFGIKSPSKLFASFGKFMMEGLGIGIKENSDEAEEEATTVADKIAGVFGGIGKKLVSSVPALSSMLDGITSGFASGGIAGAIGGGAMALASESPQFQELIDKLTPVMETLTELFGKLIEPLLPLVDILISQLSPVFESLSPLLSVLGEVLGIFANIVLATLMPALSLLSPVLDIITSLLQNIVLPVVKMLYSAFAFVYNGIARAINGIISAIDSIPFIDIKWRMPEMDSELPVADSDSTTDTNYDSSTDAKASKSTKGGTQISEITGATRDLFVDILSPLASLDSLTGIGTRIYDLLDSRLVASGSNGNIVINELTINTNGVDGNRLGEEFMDAVEIELRRRNASGARGYANAY
jgi:phage-related protein